MRRQGLLSGLAFLLLCLSRIHGLESGEELELAGSSFSSLSTQWTSFWGPSYKFAGIADEGQELHSALQSCNYTAAVVAILGPGKPARRNVSMGEPFLKISNEGPNLMSPHSLSAGAQAQENSQHQPQLSSLLGLDTLNKGILAVEAALGRPLHAFRINFMPMAASLPECKKPFAVWNVSSGDIYVDQRLVSNMDPYFEQISRIIGPFASSLTSLLTTFISQGAPNNSSSEGVFSQLVRVVLRGALLAAVASQIPLWFCIACPVVLGLLAPFIFNAGLGAAAEAICTHYSLPVDECNDLWYGAFAAAMLLSLAAAIPIVKICQLSKCGRSGAL